MDPSERLPVVAQLDDYDSPSDVIDVLGLAAFVSGAQPWARSVSLHRVRPEASLLPPEAITIRTAHSANAVATLAAGPDWTLRARRSNDRTAEITVTAVSAEVGNRVLAQATAGACEPRPPASEIVMGFWYAGQSGPRRSERAIAAAPWAQIRGNYAGAVASGIERMLMLDPTRLPGRLALLHGPPGTGKTTLLRSLAHAWRSWCAVDFVLDPERLLENLDYLMKVVLTDDRDDPDDTDDEDGRGSCPDRSRPRWRLLVLEDCDELIRAEAKSSAGQHLARLLNLTDGLLGQGLHVLVCLTTNEDLTRLHPAIVRPGRCLAQIHVGRLSQAEARVWLGTPRGVGPDGATLAELFAHRDELDRIEAERPDERVGLYL